MAGARSGLARWCVLVSVLPLAAISLACTHEMEVKDLHAYHLYARAPRSLKFSVEHLAEDEGMRSLQTAVKDGLAAHSSVERVAIATEAPPDFHPDYIAAVTPTMQFDGSGWNYLVTFPGFLIFTHAWNGFVYHSWITTSISLRRPDSPEAVASRTLEMYWSFRHCDFGRGAWTSSGWYTPFYGGINLIIGFFMIQYDQEATEPFLAAIHGPYGEFVANNVVELASGLEKAQQEAAPAPAPVPPPAPPPGGASEPPPPEATKPSP